MAASMSPRLLACERARLARLTWMWLAARLKQVFHGPPEKAMRQMLELGEFAYATVQLGRGGDPESSERVMAREAGDKRLAGAVVRGGLICWDWERGDAQGHEVVESHLFWTLRMPLSTETAGWGYVNLYREFGGDGLLMDVNYLSNLFQKEMALATERTFMGAQDFTKRKALVTAPSLS